MNKKDIQVTIVGPQWGGGASRKIDKKNVHAMLDKADTNIDTLVKTGELNLGFCKIIVTKIKGGRARSKDTIFKRRDHYRLGVQMGNEIKDRLGGK